MKLVTTNIDRGDLEEKRETSSFLMLSAWLCWLFALLVLFFRLSEMRMGGTGLRDVAIGLGVFGVVLYSFGWKIRKSIR